MDKINKIAVMTEKIAYHLYHYYMIKILTSIKQIKWNQMDQKQDID